MKTTVDGSALRTALRSVYGVLRSAKKDQAGLLIRADTDVIRVLAYDNLGLAVQSSLAATVQEPGDVALSQEALGKLVLLLALGNGDEGYQVTLESEGEGQMAVRSGDLRATLYTCRDSDAERVAALPDWEAEGKSLRLPRGELSRVVAMVAHAASKDASRPALHGVHLTTGDGLQAMAADGYNLALYKAQATDSADGWGNAVVSAEVLRRLCPLFAGQEVAVTNTAVGIRLRGDRWVAIARYDQNYPPMGKALADCSKEATLELRVSLSVLWRALDFLSRWKPVHEGMIVVKVAAGGITIAAETAYGEVLLPVAGSVVGSDAVIALNVTQACNHVSAIRNALGRSAGKSEVVLKTVGDMVCIASPTLPAYQGVTMRMLLLGGKS